MADEHEAERRMFALRTAMDLHQIGGTNDVWANLKDVEADAIRILRFVETGRFEQPVQTEEPAKTW